ASTALVMLVLGLPFGLLFGFVAGFFMVVPVVGGVLAIVPPLLLAAGTGSFRILIASAFLLGILQGVLFCVVGPHIISEAVGFGPLGVFFSLLVGIKVAGPLGAVFGLPVAAVIYALARSIYECQVLRNESACDPAHQR